ncbi:arylsulfatase : Sulfatase OS=Chthoniobacter flavus Ellin428 GN=CfE428DRAFT_6364 PE=4 SV=1: Sulfatase: Sulfatase_C: BNR_2 [Gemmata massiliana]|uniref:Sulfatase N-terminal domain-containing protein n=1 Tax=Gemmata massiliana TaxID=1210884 RepID=A0A6P2CQT7_9BACT|nr:sulfatase-like hydrolase/transferase [Gemmata massiliana]VTR91273.1 arylsulfatase : Sulfatase OS=Chthoniobacter flavus Ellin428 GN=CfE428DRAFT_6364 PE=4 SV=1: Sulfatase: Sulfatase_C: BNR_2 [Gemmata massiliana]
MKHILPALAALLFLTAPLRATDTPNIVVVFTDDQGYGDVGCFGAKDFATPNIDKLAKQGTKFTDFHVSQPVCSASRASLLTGCYANRLGIHGALGPNARHGIHANETTLAEMCKSKGYATGMVGKWHLGHHPQFLPTKHGFDSYFGLPYSNDMWPEHPEAKKGTYPPLPLIENEKIVDPNVTAAVQSQLTQRYTKHALGFIAAHKSEPFFLYVAHSMPHVPLFASEAFQGKSKQGLYGDVIQEIDWSVGQILSALDEHKLADNTLVIFTCDNGPWLSYGNHAGTTGQLREGKGTVWEGGIRVPFVARWPGKIPAGSVCREPAMTIDVLPTVAKIIGADLPKTKIDGKDIGPLLRGEPNAKSPQEVYFHYYNTNELQAVRSGKWKLILPHTYRTMAGQPQGKDGTPGKYKQVKIEVPELYDLDADVGESKNVTEANPNVVKRLLVFAESAREDLGDSLTKRVGKNTREPGRVPEEKKPTPPSPLPKGKGEKDLLDVALSTEVSRASSPFPLGRGDGGVGLRDKPEFTSELVFPLHKQHNHAPGIIECPNGDLLVSWYRGSGERSADDVAVYGARKKVKAPEWGAAFLMVDTPGFPDCNTTMWVDKDDKLWLFWPVIIANSWESCITQYRVSSDFQKDGTPKWTWQDTILLKPKNFEEVMLREFGTWKKQISDATKLPVSLGDDVVKKRVGDKLLSRLGWQPRCKPIQLASGRILLPLYSDTYSAGLMAISDDGGKTWTASQPIAGFGNIQPAVLERKDGTLIAYMRENGVFKKIRVAESKDKGESWGTVTSSELPNPGSGLDAVRLASGNWALIYNDTTRGRSSLAVSLSDDEGKTWKWTRHLEKHDTGSYHYPAIIQSKDGGIHAVYSYFVADGKSMKHARFTEAWVKEGDAK